MDSVLFGFSLNESAFIINLAEVTCASLTPKDEDGAFRLHIEADLLIEVKCNYTEGISVIEGLAASAGAVFLRQ